MKALLQKLILVLIFFAGAGNTVLHAQDFVHNEGPLNETSSWTPEPGDFTTDNQTFTINGEAFVDGDWTLASDGTDLIINTDEEITFQSGTNVTFDGITVEFTDEGRADLILDGNIQIIGGVNWEGDPGDFWSVEIEKNGDQTISVDQDSKLIAYNFDSEKTSGTLDLISEGSPSIVFEAINNLDLDYSGDALFRDNGNTFVVGDDIEMDGEAGAYALTGTLEHRVIDGNSDYEIVVPELNNLYVWVREDGNPRFRDEDDYTQQITIIGDFTIDMNSIGDFEFNDVILDIGGTFDITHNRPEDGHDNGDGEGEIDVDDAIITIGGDFVARFSKDLPDGDENIDVDDAEITVNENLYIFVFEDGEFDFDDSQFNVVGYAEFDIRNGGIVDMDESNFSVDGNLTILIDETGELDTGDLENGSVFVGGDLIVNLLEHNDASLVNTDKFDVTGETIINENFVESDISPFALIEPEDGFELIVAGDESTEVEISWEAAESLQEVSYTWHLDNRGGDFEQPIISLPSDDNGTATQITLTIGAIDQLLEDNGVEVSDMLEADWTVTAETTDDIRFAEAPFSIDLERGMTTSTDPITERPAEFSLDQNFPNPFNPTTVIPYSVDQTGHVSLEIFNMIGQRVAVVVDRSIQAGSHTVTFDASGLTSGVYMYRLTIGDQVDYRSMTLIK